MKTTKLLATALSILPLLGASANASLGQKKISALIHRIEAKRRGAQQKIHANGGTRVVHYYISPSHPVQGDSVTLFAEVQTDFSGQEILLQGNFDSAPVTFDQPTTDLFVANLGTFNSISHHTLAGQIFIQSHSDAEQLRNAISQLNSQISDLNSQIAAATDPAVIAQLQAQLNQDEAEQAQLTQSLANLKSPVDEEDFSFDVAANNSSGNTFPHISSITPNVATTNAAKQIVITGANFPANPVVTLGGQAVVVTSANATSISGTAPAFASQGVESLIVSGGGTNAELDNAYFVTSAVLNTTPVVMVQAPNSAVSGTPATFTSTGSSDPSNGTLTYAWQLLSKPASSQLSTGAAGSNSSLTFTPDSGGTYVVELTVTSSASGATNSAIAFVNATLANSPLTATAPAITIARSGTATSQISVTDANAPYVTLSYYITRQPLYGPVSVSSTGLVTYHELSSSTVVLVDLIGVTVVDNLTPQNSYTVTIPVTITPSTLPSFSATSCSRQSNTAPFLAFCGATNFAAPNGSIASIFWNYGDGTPSQPILLTGNSMSGYSHYYTSFGTFYEEISVTDNLGAVNNFLFTRAFSNSPIPTAKFTLSSVSGAAPFAITANATASSSPVNSTLTYRWTWGDGSAIEGGTGAAFATRSHTYNSNGTFQITLAVLDTLGNYTQNVGTVYVGVTAPATGSPPSAFADITSTRMQLVGTPITFDGSNYSMDANPSGSISGYNWSFNDFATCASDGCTSTGASASHAYPAAQSYFPYLTVTNTLGGVSNAVFYEVMAVNRGYAPRAMFNLAQKSGVVPFQISVDGSSSFDYDGHIVSYTWSWGDGSANSTGAAASHSYLAAGTYFPNLTVVDDDGNSNTYSQMITVSSTMVPQNVRDDVGGSDDGQMQILTNACAHGSGLACDQLAKIISAAGDAQTAANLEARACALHYQPACSSAQ